jgi:hypothetical protein
VHVKYSMVEGEFGHSDVVALIKESVQDSGSPYEWFLPAPPTAKEGDWGVA